MGRLLSDCSHGSLLQRSCRSRAVTFQQHASRRTHISIGNDGRSKPLNTTGKALVLKSTEVLLLTSAGAGLYHKSCGSPLHLRYLK